MSTLFKILVTIAVVALCVAAAMLRHLWWPPLLTWVHINNDDIKGFAGLITIFLFGTTVVGLLVRVWKPKKQDRSTDSSHFTGNRSANLDISGNLTNSSVTTNVYNTPVAGRESHHSIETEIDYRTNQVITHTRITITKLDTTFQRPEADRVEEQLRMGRSVALTGNAGSGKSGIAVMIATQARNRGRLALLLDARRLKHVEHERDLRMDFGVNEPLTTVFGRIGSDRGLRLIVDQLDNVIGLAVAGVLADLAVESSRLPGVEVVVVCRKRETHESKLVERLFAANFFEVDSHEITPTLARQALTNLNIDSPKPELLSLCRNLLNLEIVATIVTRNPSFDFREVMTEVELWTAYLDVFQEREEIGSSLDEAQLTIREAVRLAREALRAGDQMFQLPEVVSTYQRRLISWEMIRQVDGRFYRFKHEKLQDFLYARDAADRALKPDTVMFEVNLVRSRNILLWMDRIYGYRRSPQRIEFAKAILGLQD